MRNIISIAVLFTCVALFSGCSKTVYVPQLPDAPESLKKPCDDLKEIPKGSDTKDAVKVIVGNYSMYHECSDRNDSWISWYNKQKETIGNTKIR